MTVINYQWIGSFVIMVGWAVVFLMQRHYVHKSEICRLVDMFRSCVIRAEDIALDYWVNAANNVHSYQLGLHVSRLGRLAMEIKHLKCRKYRYPSTLIKDFRRAVTLDADARDVALSSKDERPREIMVCSVKLQEHFKKPL